MTKGDEGERKHLQRPAEKALERVQRERNEFREMARPMTGYRDRLKGRVAEE